uniref:Uncharacterized protein n=1 Tax=Parascaris equorum TaxID=6256 RepID=A0A914R947_PAREQ
MIIEHERKVMSYFDIDVGFCGMVLFNDVARIGFPLTRYTTNSDVTTAILGMNFNGGISNIAAGMRTAMAETKSTREQGYEEMVKAAGDPSRFYDRSNFTELVDVIDEVCNEAACMFHQLLLFY